MSTQHTRWEQIFRNLCKVIKDMKRLKGSCKMARMTLCLQTSTLFWIHVNGRMTSNSVFLCFCTMHCYVIVQHKLKKCTFFWLNILIFNSWCLLPVSNPRVHLQEDGSICSYGMVRFTCIGNSTKPYLCIQPSSWRWTLGLETCKRHQKLKY